MLKKTLLISLLFFVACLSPVAAADQLPAGMAEVGASQVWSAKATWIGQKAVIVPAKMVEHVGFLFLYQDPTTSVSGVDQLSLGRSLSGKTLTIKGLYTLKKATATEYYWYLTAEGGAPAVWLKDSRDKTLADEPFALEAEFSQDKRWQEQLAALPGLAVWYNSNSAVTFAKGASADHLAPLTISEFHSGGPFSETYQLTFTKEDGSVLDWTAGVGTTPPAYSNRQFYDLLQKTFYLKSPYDAHPAWPEARWAAIKARKVAVGMDQDMVVLSWGATMLITQAKDGTETWEYPDHRYLIFKGKTLTKIKVPKPPAPKNAKADSKEKDKAKDKNLPAVLELIEVPEAGPVEKPVPPAKAGENDKAKSKDKDTDKDTITEEKR